MVKTCDQSLPGNLHSIILHSEQSEDNWQKPRPLLHACTPLAILSAVPDL